MVEKARSPWNTSSLGPIFPLPDHSETLPRSFSDCFCANLPNCAATIIVSLLNWEIDHSGKVVLVILGHHNASAHFRTIYEIVETWKTRKKAKRNQSQR